MAEQGPLEDEEAELSDVEHSVLGASHIITCLYRFSIAIQNPAPKERLNKIVHIDVSHFKEWDIKHIYGKFSPVDPENSFRVAEYLCERLGKANTKRRQLLRYYEAHHEKISKDIDDPSPLKNIKYTNTPKPVAPTMGGGSTRVPANTQMSPSVYTTTQTTVYTIQDKLNPVVEIERDEDELSQTSFATSINHVTRIRVPPPPNEIVAFNGQPFQCPYCYTITKVKGRNDWKYVGHYPQRFYSMLNFYFLENMYF